MERPNVVLELENVSSEGDYVEDPIPLHDSIVDAASLEYHDWNSLIQQCSRGLRSLKLLIRRDLESSQDNVHMVWDMGTCCSLLQCMYCGKMEISSSNFQKVLEGAAFFGVDVAMSALLLQIHETTSNIEVLKCIPKFWSIAKGMGVQSLACACLDVFAVNFEDVVQEAGFEDLPSALLAACIDHRQLTVRSEKKLCEVVFNWLMYHQQSFQRDQSSEMLKAVYGVKHERSCERIFASLDSTTSSILGKIRVLLLPLEFLQGHLYWKYPANVFSVGASQVVGYDKLSLLIEEAGKKKPLDVLAEKGDELTIRITKHSLRLDLAGCQQTTAAMLFRAVLQDRRKSSDIDPQCYILIEAVIENILRSEGSRAVSEPAHVSRSNEPIAVPSDVSQGIQDVCRDLALNNLCELNLEGCWRISQESLIIWLRLACPKLRILNVSHCPQLQVNMLPQISLSCQSLETVDFSLDLSSLLGQPVNLVHQGLDIVDRRYSRHLESSWWLPCSLIHLTNISLQGRSSLMDWDLQMLSRCCPNILDVNLRGCTELTDRGICQFLVSFDNLRSLRAAFTAFGCHSMNVLLEKYAVSTFSSPPSCGTEKSSSSGRDTCVLSTLDLEGCSGVDEVLLANLLSRTSLLTNLILGNTRVDDNAIFTFEGTSLQRLDLRETQVTEQALGYLISRNSCLKVLNIRGCKEVKCSFSSSDERTKLLKVTLQNAIKSTGLDFEELAVGWSFCDFTWNAWKPVLHNLRSLSVGLGGSMSEITFCSLSEICPCLEHLALSFQIISDKSILSLLKSMTKIRMLELSHCLGEISSQSINVLATCYGSNLTCLRLEWGVAWLTDTDICLLTNSCKGLRQLSLIGCKLLTSRVWQNNV